MLRCCARSLVIGVVAHGSMACELDACFAASLRKKRGRNRKLRLSHSIEGLVMASWQEGAAEQTPVAAPPGQAICDLCQRNSQDRSGFLLCSCRRGESVALHPLAPNSVGMTVEFECSHLITFWNSFAVLVLPHNTTVIHRTIKPDTPPPTTYAHGIHGLLQSGAQVLVACILIALKAEQIRGG